MDTANTLPHLNALLNTLTIVLLLTAFVLIRQRRIDGHRRAMLGAIALSALFLVSYVIYHFSAPIFVFRGEGLVRPLYYALLISHVILAVVALPLILLTAWRGLTRADPRHRTLARWTWPLWMYVSVSGVIVYLLLYHIYV
jgi:putative membrane protein